MFLSTWYTGCESRQEQHRERRAATINARGSMDAPPTSPTERWGKSMALWVERRLELPQFVGGNRVETHPWNIEGGSRNGGNRCSGASAMLFAIGVAVGVAGTSLPGLREVSRRLGEDLDDDEDDEHDADYYDYGYGAGANSTGHDDHHGCGHHEEVDLFNLGDYVHQIKHEIIVSFALVLGVTIVIESVCEYFEHRADAFFQKITVKVYKEFATLGLISLALFFLRQTGVLGHGDQLIAFEMVHLAVFYLGLIAIIQSVIAFHMCNVVARSFYAADLLGRARGARYFVERFGAAWWRGPAFSLTTLGKQMEFHIFRGLFCRLYKLPPNFDYAW